MKSCLHDSYQNYRLHTLYQIFYLSFLFYFVYCIYLTCSINLRCITCYFDVVIYCKIIVITIFSISITLHNYSTILLSIFIILYIKFLCLIYSLQVCTIKQHWSYHPPYRTSPDNHHFTVFFTSLTFSDSTCKWYHAVTCLSLTYLCITYNVIKVYHVVSNSRISSFLRVE